MLLCFSNSSWLSYGNIFWIVPLDYTHERKGNRSYLLLKSHSRLRGYLCQREWATLAKCSSQLNAEWMRKEVMLQLQGKGNTVFTADIFQPTDAKPPCFFIRGYNTDPSTLAETLGKANVHVLVMKLHHNSCRFKQSFLLLVSVKNHWQIRLVLVPGLFHVLSIKR